MQGGSYNLLVIWFFSKDKYSIGLQDKTEEKINKQTLEIKPKCFKEHFNLH